MKPIAELLAIRLTENRDLKKPLERHRVGLLESWISMAGNVFLTLLKAVFGILTNSITLMADAAHSASDIFSSLMVLVGFTLARRKPDREHPHGHGRTEYLAGLAVAVMLIGAGIAFFYTAYTRLVSGAAVNPSLAAIIAVFIALLCKEFLYYFSAKLGRLIKSDALIADAWHHRTDSLSSVLVLIALGGSYFGLPVIDAYLGFVVSLFIVYAGVSIARNSCSRLLGAAPDQELCDGVASCAREIEGVIDAHDLEIHDYGSWKVVTLHIGVSGSLSLDEAHIIAHRVEDHISSCFYCDTVVHLDPR